MPYSEVKMDCTLLGVSVIGGDTYVFFKTVTERPLGLRKIVGESPFETLNKVGDAILILEFANPCGPRFSLYFCQSRMKFLEHGSRLCSVCMME